MYDNFLKKMKAKLSRSGLFPLREQAQLNLQILQERLEMVLPWAMEQSAIDFWIIAARENCMDPILKTLYTWDMPDVRRIGILAFHRNQKGTVRMMMMGPHSAEMTGVYEKVQTPDETVWETLARIVRECAPQKIAVNRSRTDGFFDGLSSTAYDELREALGADAEKLCSSDALAMRWLQRVTPLEKKTLQALLELTHDLIAYAFSKQVIEVGKTTTTDLEWFIRDVIKGLGFNYWFGPDVDLQRQGSNNSKMSNEVIQPGDLLHCDVGINSPYVQLHTDVQRVAYVLKDGETDAPHELKELLAKGNRLQDIVSGQIKTAKTGNDALLNSVTIAQDEGLKPMVYTHPIGTFGHGAGPHIGRYDKQEFIPVAGERSIEKQTCFALELNVSEKLKVWDNQQVFMYLEEVIHTNQAVEFVNGRQESLIRV